MAFTATYAGTATVKLADGLADIVASGAGAGVPIGLQTLGEDNFLRLTVRVK